MKISKLCPLVMDSFEVNYAKITTWCSMSTDYISIKLVLKLGIRGKNYVHQLVNPAIQN